MSLAGDFSSLKSLVLTRDIRDKRGSGCSIGEAFLPTQEPFPVKQQIRCFASSRLALTKQHAASGTTDIHTGLKLHLPFTTMQVSWCTGHTPEG